MMLKILAVALGGAIGSTGRYVIALLVGRLSNSNYPIETLTANLIGCLLIGLLWGYFERVPLSNEFRLFLFTGMLGGFTTFSTFAYENHVFLKSGDFTSFAVYTIASFIIGFLVVFFGMYLVK